MSLALSTVQVLVRVLGLTGGPKPILVAKGQATDRLFPMLECGTRLLLMKL